MKVDFSKPGGLYVYQDTLAMMQDYYTQMDDSIAKALGEKFVVSGCVEGGGQVTSGAVVINGQRLDFVGGPQLPYVTWEDLPAGVEQFDDNTLKGVYNYRRAKMVAIADANSFPYAQLKRLPLAGSNILDSLEKYHKILKSLINFEPEVILSGMAVTNVTTGPNTCDISAGLVMFNGQLVATPARSGSYPAYLTEAGAWQTAVPGAGLYITFDPHTSQRYQDVLNRAMVKTGKIEMYETLTDRFVAGVGRWEMKGFVLCAALQNRVPVGLWFDAVAEANVSDAFNQTAGPTRKTGTKDMTLTENEIPVHNFKTFSAGAGNDTSPFPAGLTPYAYVRRDLTGNFSYQIAGVGGAGNEPTMGQTNDYGGGQSFSKVQPSTIVVYVKRA